MKDARYLIRLANTSAHQPADQGKLLGEARRLAEPHKGKAINLRVSPHAIEFDLFCSPDANPRTFTDAFKSLGDLVTCKRLDTPPAPVDAEANVAEARRLFNEHRFWEVYEVLEGIWKERGGPEKQMLQGLILVAAALVHAQKNEDAVMRAMLADALKRLEAYPGRYYGWDVAAFRDHFARVLSAKKVEIPTV